MPDQEQILPMIFPVYGINLITEFELQLPNTTPVGLNVRGFEPTTFRDRGGSRPGLSKWIDAFVNGTGPCQIQDLNQLTTLAADALLTSFGLDLVGVPTIPDPNNPQYVIPLYGSGVQLSKNTGSTGPANTSSAYSGVTTASGTGPVFTAALQVDQTNIPVTSLSGTGNVASGSGFIAVKVGTSYYFQFPVFTS